MKEGQDAITEQFQVERVATCERVLTCRLSFLFFPIENHALTAGRFFFKNCIDGGVESIAIIVPPDVCSV
jgi:hypothetical protein